MMIFFLALIPLLAVNGKYKSWRKKKYKSFKVCLLIWNWKGESCNNVEDPIKRDETASGNSDSSNLILQQNSAQLFNCFYELV